jgi:CheY-like chemotaxis protein
MRILIADDDSASRRFAARALRELGHLVESADDGEALIRLAEAAEPDLILSDIDMPYCDGISACRRLREALPRTRFLLMTGDPISVDAARAAGFRAVLLKPFGFLDLKAALQF